MRLPAAFFLMSIQHALLTSLLEKPSSGYELARRFDKSMGYFWSATHQQIYRELGRMAEAGWVSMEEEEDGRKKTYTVLPPGREELARWVLEPTVSSDNREEVLVKLRAEAVIGPLGFIDEMQAEYLPRDRAARFFGARSHARTAPATRCAAAWHRL
jgi:DNA-binding PadR family transcriptional regulator